MTEINVKIPLVNGEGRDRVEVDRFDDEGYIYLDVFDNQDRPSSTCVILTAAEAWQVSDALREAAK